MNMPLTIAQDQTVSAGSALVNMLMEKLDILYHPNELLDTLGQMPLLGAMVAVTVGVLCVFNGYRWHKWVVVVLAFMCGLGIGQVLNEQIGRSNVVAVSVGILCAVVATPLLRLTVAVFGGITGAFIGANTWTAMQATPADAQWAGAAMGFILLAMASLILFRLVVVLFTSVGGAAMVVFGVITLLLQVDTWAPAVRNTLTSNQMLIPVLVLLAAVCGFVLQESRVRADAKSKKLKGGAGAGNAAPA